MAEVKLTSINKRFGTVDVIKNLTLHISDGEFLVLVGGSGCGKSTTLRLIAGLETADTGDILIGDRRVNNLAPKDRDIAMVFQNYALYPHMTVYDNIAFGLKLRKVDKTTIARRVQEVAEMLDITPYLKRKPKELSGGQRQRVALGRALVREPQVFLMDEPLSNLDAKLRSQMRTEIKKLHQKIGVTTVYVTHDQIEAMTMGDRIAVMKDGLIQQLASPKETYDFPANKFVAGFIGSPSMNFFTVKVQDVAGSHVQVTTNGIDLRLPLPAGIDVKSYLNQEVALGIRPEYLSLPHRSPDDSQPVKCSLEVVEPSGSRTYLHGTIGGQPFVAEVDTADMTPEMHSGAQLILQVDVGRVHLFDPKTDATLVSTQQRKTPAVSAT